MRKAGRFASAHRTCWSPEDTQRAVDLLDNGMSIPRIAAQMGRKPQGVREQLRLQHGPVRVRIQHANGMSIADVARELGISKQVVGAYIRRGILIATRRLIVRKFVFTLAPTDVHDLIAQHGGYLPLTPDSDWAPLVDAARVRFQERYISRNAVAQLVHVCSTVVRRWESGCAFPAPAMQLAERYGGAHYERQAVWA